MKKSLYDILQINQNATPNEIKTAYRKLAKIYHPDINKTKDAEDKFKEINAAYEVLSDTQKKKDYDNYGDNLFKQQNFNDFYKKNNFNKNHYSQFDFNFEDIFENIFRKNNSFNNDFNNTLYHSINIDFKTAILGGKVSFYFNKQHIDINIPSNTSNGQKFKIKKGSYSTINNDLILTVNIIDNEYSFDNDGNLIKHFDISLKTALFGDKITVNTLYKTLTITIPKNTKHLQKFRIKNFGINSDLILIANIVLPKIEDLDKTLVKNLKNRLP